MDTIQLAHGGGGKLTDDLIATVIFKYLPRPSALLDSACISVEPGWLAFTTDSYVISPIFFPGGDVGKLAVFGTCNDLAMVGAVPQYLSLGLIIEEGFALSDLHRVMQSLAATAAESGVTVVTGDTKVVAHGQTDGIYINTSGIGRVQPEACLGFDRIAEGDAVLISGTIGDHGLAVMANREGLEFRTTITSDVAGVAGVANRLVREFGSQVRFLRDPTRGGLAGVLVDIAANTGREILVHEPAIPCRPEVKAAADVLGLDLLNVANEGKFVAVVAGAAAVDALARLREHPLGQSAAIIGHIGGSRPTARVVMQTAIGGRRVVQKPHGEQLPRIC